MPIDFEADLETMFALDEFAVSIPYQLPTGETGDLVAIFDNPTSTSELGEAGFLASAPSVTVPTSALPVGFGEGAILTIKGAEYLVAHEPEPDGEGVSVVTLERAEP